MDSMNSWCQRVTFPVVLFAIDLVSSGELGKSTYDDDDGDLSCLLYEYLVVSSSHTNCTQSPVPTMAITTYVVTRGCRRQHSRPKRARPAIAGRVADGR